MIHPKKSPFNHFTVARVLRFGTARFLLMLWLGLALATTVQGNVTIPITGYDILRTPPSGFGTWTHVYDGTITDLGISLVNKVLPVTLFNETGGSGTINDGIVSNSSEDSQLFVGLQATDGTVVDPVITLYLGGPYKISEIRIFGGSETSNLIPGRIGTLSVDLGGLPEIYNTTPFGAAMDWGGFQNDRITIAGLQTDVVTNQVVLSGFASGVESSEGGDLFFNYFSITEIEFVGVLVPEPTACTLALAALCLAMSRRRAF